jgi:hypothetical protein
MTERISGIVHAPSSPGVAVELFARASSIGMDIPPRKSESPLNAEDAPGFCCSGWQERDIRPINAGAEIIIGI